MSKFLLVLLVSARLFAAACTPASGYSYCRTLTIAHAKVPNTDQSAFPVLITGIVPEWKTTANGGHIHNTTTLNSVTIPADLIFTSDSGGSSKLVGCDYDGYTPTTGQVWIFCQVATVSHTSDTVFYASYGNASVTTFQYTQSSTYDSNFIADWHMDDNTASTSFVDASGHQSQVLGGSNIGGSAPCSGVGLINLSFAIGGTNCGFGQQLNTAVTAAVPVTVSVFVKKGSGTNFATLWTQSAGTSNTNRMDIVMCDGVNCSPSNGLVGTGCPNNTGVTSALASGSTYYFAVTWDASKNCTDYLALVGTDANVTAFTSGVAGTFATFDSMRIGERPDANACCNWSSANGTMDELRVSKSLRSVDWLNTEYHNYASPSTFLTIGGEVVPAATIVVGVP